MTEKELNLRTTRNSKRGAVVILIVVVVGLLVHIFMPVLIRHHQRQECKQMVARFRGICVEDEWGVIIYHTEGERRAFYEV